MHLKDVIVPCAHDSCTVGAGKANCRGVLAEFAALGYDHPITREDEPFNRDPMPECLESLRRVRTWWSEAGPSP